MALVVAWPAAAAARAEDREEKASERLEQIRHAIQESRERLAAFEGRSRGLLETLEAVDRAAGRLRDEVSRAREAEAQAEARRAEIEQRAALLARRRAAAQRAMGARASALYRAGEAGPLPVLFSAANLREVLARARVLTLLLRHDRRLLERFRADSEALAQAVEGARRAGEEHKSALERLERRRAELEQERAARRRVLASVRADRARERAALAELESAASALEEALARLELRPSRERSGSFAARRGQLEPPVEARVARGFGRVVDAEFRTQTFRKGIDFDAPWGAPVRAVADGEVRFAGWFRGYGNMVILDHGDRYFTVSAHLAQVRPEVGDAVRSGDVIGTVGDTGSLAGPLLYFEIRQGGQPVDPGEWLRDPPAR